MVNPGLHSVTKHLLLFLIFLGSFIASAQKYSMGIKAGPLLNWSGFADKDLKHEFSTGVFFGYSAAGLISFPMKEAFECVIEAGYSKQGRRLHYQDGQDDYMTLTKFNCGDATMLLRKSFDVKIEKNVTGQWFLNVGPSLTYWSTGKGYLTANQDGPHYPYTITFTEPPTFNKMYVAYPNHMLFGLAIGTGIKAPLNNNQHISVELRFVSGHTFLAKKDNPSNDPKNPEARGPYLGLPAGAYQNTMLTNIKSISLNVAYTFDLDVQRSKKGKSTLNKKIKVKRKR
jgi:hypothetical protein